MPARSTPSRSCASRRSSIRAARRCATSCTRASTGKDMASVNTDRLLAAYMSQLPAGVSATIDGGVVKLSLAGAALSVSTPAGEVDVTVNKSGSAIALKNDDFAIQVTNDGWKEF